MKTGLKQGEEQRKETRIVYGKRERWIFRKIIDRWIEINREEERGIERGERQGGRGMKTRRNIMK